MNSPDQDDELVDLGEFSTRVTEQPTEELTTVPVNPEEAWMIVAHDHLQARHKVLMQEEARLKHAVTLARAAHDSANKEMQAVQYSLHNLEDALEFARRRYCGGS